MYDLFCVKVAKCKSYLGSNELNSRLIKPLYFIQIIIYVSSRHVLKEEIDSQFILEYIVHRVDKWVVSVKQYFLLNFDVLHLVLL